ncbi:MAG: type IV toxin-antitoxin system AbiEi family antitoxin domain-containing protein [Actinomycetota bacterium]
MPTNQKDRRKRLLEVAGPQSGLFTAKQALDAGYSYSNQSYHADHGNWIRVDHGLYRLPPTEWPTGRHEDLVRWVLWSGDRAVVSHETAMSVLDLGDADPARVHLTVPPGFRKTARGVVLHRGSVPKGDIQLREGVRVTTPPRSILDVAAGDLDQDQFARAVKEALDRGLVTRRQLLGRADTFGAHAALRIERALLAEASA